jgi:hypothetical protein
MLLIPCALFLPVTFFINTTPQGLACLLALIIILSEPQATTYKLLLSIAACFIHPFFGAPLLIYCLFRLGEQLNLKHRLKFFRRAATILPAAFIFPILFLINQLLTDKTIAFTWPHLSQIIRACHFNPAVAGEKSLTNYLFTLNHQSDFLYDLLYIYGFNYKIIFLIISLLGAILLLRKKNPPISKAPLLFAILFGFNYFVMKNFIDFKFLTEKEASDYLGRISELVFYFLLPTFLYFCARLFNGLLHNNKIVAQQNVIPSEVDGAVEGYVWHLWINRLFIIFLLTTTSVASLYLSYPVFDSYKNSKFINMSKNDIAAVKAISADAEAKYNLGATNGHPEALEGRHYIVLANQMVAAAALNEFGFAKYFGEEYFYSIPNANPDGFYQYFLSMMEDDPTRETAAAAMKSAGVDQLYFVANTYWRNSAAIIKKAKTTANRWKSINNKVFIFYYSN